MKKTYEKPVLVRKGKLSMVVAGASIVNGAAP
ncbi:putative RiPP precursor [Mesorhizobium hawassense]|uniref:Putative RiPP n=1 Tax=Mesorhizobium hawassense TaxID=1209954 RepID=A0A330H0Q5_9HYPH|nr:putative RiPP precursor [Mesorhizobium hawassense]RAZ81875.1 putative RiPP precursor [Mesorhizobium hawassense]